MCESENEFILDAHIWFLHSLWFWHKFFLISNEDSFQPLAKKTQLVTRETQTGHKTTNAEAAASSNFLEKQQRFQRAIPIENEGIGGEEERDISVGRASDEIEIYLSQLYCNWGVEVFLGPC